MCVNGILKEWPTVQYVECGCCMPEMYTMCVVRNLTAAVSTTGGGVIEESPQTYHRFEL